MRNIEEIEQNKKLIITERTARHMAGRVFINRVESSFFCGFDEDGWEHVSICPFRHTYTPSWDDMCVLKDIFWGEEEAVIQIHPKKSEYVNMMPNCLHLWKNKQWSCLYNGG